MSTPTDSTPSMGEKTSDDAKEQKEDKKRSRLVYTPAMLAAAEEPNWWEKEFDIRTLAADMKSDNPKYLPKKYVEKCKKEERYITEFFSPGGYGCGEDEDMWKTKFGYGGPQHDGRMIRQVLATFAEWAFHSKGLALTSIKDLLKPVRRRMTKIFSFAKSPEVLIYGYKFADLYGHTGCNVFTNTWDDLKAITGSASSITYPRPLYPQDAERMILCMGLHPYDLRDRAFLAVAVKIAVSRRYWVETPFDDKHVVKQKSGDWELLLSYSSYVKMLTAVVLKTKTLEHDAFSMYYDYRVRSGNTDGSLFEMDHPKDVTNIVRRGSKAAGYPEGFFVAQSLVDGAMCSIVDQAYLQGFSKEEAEYKAVPSIDMFSDKRFPPRLEKQRGWLDSRLDAARKQWIQTNEQGGHDYKGRGPNLKDVLLIGTIHPELLVEDDRKNNENQLDKDGLPCPVRLPDKRALPLKLCDTQSVLKAMLELQGIHRSLDDMTVEEVVSNISDLFFQFNTEEGDNSFMECVKALTINNTLSTVGAQRQLIKMLLATKILRADNWTTCYVPKQVIEHLKLPISSEGPPTRDRKRRLYDVGGSNPSSNLLALQRREKIRKEKKRYIGPEPAVNGIPISDMTEEDLQRHTQHLAVGRSMPSGRGGGRGGHSEVNPEPMEKRTETAPAPSVAAAATASSRAHPQGQSVPAVVNITVQRKSKSGNLYTVLLSPQEVHQCKFGKDIFKVCLNKNPKSVSWRKSEQCMKKYVQFECSRNYFDLESFEAMSMEEVKGHVDRTGSLRIHYLLETDLDDSSDESVSCHLSADI